MFFAILLVILAGIFISGHEPDQYGWMAFICGGWVAGYLDCRRFSRSDREPDRVMPPDIHEPIPDDAHSFET